MGITLFASRQSKVLRCRRRHSGGSGGSTPKYLLRNTLSSLCRHSSTECDSPSQDYESLVNQVVQLLRSPENEWNSDQLHPLLFSASTTLPPHLLTITLRLASSSKSLKFLDYLRANASSEQYPSLSSVFQGVLELASREPTSQTKFLKLYKTSKEWNVPLNTKSACVLVQSFGKAKMVEESLLLFKELDPSLKSTHFCNTLIGVMLRLGRLDDAVKVFEEMLEPNVGFPPNDLTCNIIFSELLKRENSSGTSFSEEEIVSLVRMLGQNGVLPDTIKLTKLVTKLCGKGKTGLAWDLLCDVMKMGSAVEASPFNVLLTELGREGDFHRMDELLAKMREMGIQPSVVTFGILINHLCKSRRMDEALKLFETMRVDVEPDVILFNTLIDGLSKVGRQEEGLSLLEQMRMQDEHRPNTITYNCLIDGFCKSGEIDKALELYHQMNEEGVMPNVVTLNILVDGMCKHGRISSAVEFFFEVQRKGIKGNATTYTALVLAFCNVNNINKAMHYFDEMMSSECSTNAVVLHRLISGLSYAGRMDDAGLVVSKYKQAGFDLDIACYNELIRGFLQEEKSEKVQELLEEMEQIGVKPDNVTYNTLVSYSAKTGNYALARKLMRKMIEEGLVPSVATYEAVIQAYCSDGNVDEAYKIFKEMCSTSKFPPNPVIYNILINSLSKNDDVESAVSLMDDMKVRGTKPNTTTYNALFKGIRDKNMLQKALELMDRMREDACSPDYITIQILTEWLSAVGEVKKLENFIQGSKVSSCTV